MKITGKTKISEILGICPDSAEILIEYGLMCVGCPLAGKHTLEATKELYGFSDKDIEEMLKRINELIEEKRAC